MFATLNKYVILTTLELLGISFLFSFLFDLASIGKEALSDMDDATDPQEVMLIELSDLPTNIDAFISYSRRNSDFTKKLFERLSTEHKVAWYDMIKEPLLGIPSGSRWWVEIKRGIEAADNFIFIITPDSIQSQYCHAEIHHAIQFNKRAIPIVKVTQDEIERYTEKAGNESEEVDHLAILKWIIENVEDREMPDSVDPAGESFKQIALDNWKWISDWQFINFSVEEHYDDNLVDLLERLKSDSEYVHTLKELHNRAARWDEGKGVGGVLRGRELEDAEIWLNSNLGKEKKPPLNQLVIKFIAESRKITQRNNRTRFIFVSGALVIVSVLALVSLVLYQQSESNLSLAEARGTAVAQEAATSEANLVEAWNTQSLFLADQANQELVEGSPQRALLLAMESLAHYPLINNLESYTALQNALNSPVQELAYLRHEGDVRGASWSADEQRVLTWSEDGTARVWDIATNKAQHILSHEGAVYGASWSPDNRHILTWSNKCDLVDEFIGGIDFYGCLFHQVRIWDLDNVSEPIILDHAAAVLGAQWDKSGSAVLSWSQDGAARLWDPTNGEIFRTLTHENLRGALWHPTRNFIATWSFETIKFWELPFSQPMVFEKTYGDDVPGMYQGINGITWEPDSPRVLSWAMDGTIEIWNPEEEQPLVGHHNYPVYGAEWSPNASKILAWQYSDGAINGQQCLGQRCSAVIWLLDGSAEPQVLPHSPGVFGSAWSHDSTQVLTWSTDGLIRMWSEGSWDVGSMGLRHDLEVYGANWSEDDRYVLSWSADNTAAIWSTTDGNQVRVVRHDEDVTGAIWNRDESLLLTWSKDDTARIWRLDGADATRYLFHPNPIMGATWNSDETLVVSWDDTGLTRLWLPDGQVKQHKSEAAVFGGVFSNDEERFAIWTYTDVTIWNLSNEDMVTIPDAGATRNVYVHWSQDDSRILTVGGRVEVWDAATGENLLRLQPGGTVYDAQWIDNEQRLFVVTSGGLYFFETLTGEKVLEFNHSRTRSADLNHDGTKILSWDDEDQAHIWDVSSGEILQSFQHISDLPGEEMIGLAQWFQNETRVLTRAGNAVTVWDAETGEKLYSMAHENHLYGSQLNRDESLLLTWELDGTISVWNMEHPDEPQYILQTNAFTIDAFWSPSETQVLIQADPRTFLWTIGSKDYHVVASGNSGDETFLPGRNVWSADGTKVMLQFGDRVEVKTVDLESMLVLARDHSLRLLSNQERERFFLPLNE